MKLSKDEKVVLYTLLKFKDTPIGMLGLNKLLYDYELNSVNLNGKTLTNLNLFSFEIPKNVKVLELYTNDFIYGRTLYILATENYSFLITYHNEYVINFDLYIKTPPLSYDIDYKKTYDFNSVCLVNETSTDRIDIYDNSPFGIAGILEGYNDIKETSYRLEFGKSYSEYSEISDIHKTLKKLINSYGENIDIIFYKQAAFSSKRDENFQILKTNYKSFYKDFLMMLDLYRNIVIDNL